MPEGIVTLANMRISAVDGAAFLDFGVAGVLTDNVGRLVKVYDSARRAITGRVYQGGTGETLSGVELVTGGAAWTGAAGAIPPNGWSVGQAGVFTIFDSGDGAPYDVCLKLAVNATPDVNPYIYQSITTLVGQLYKFSSAYKNGDATAIILSLGTSAGGAQYYTISKSGVTWTTVTKTFTANTTTTVVSLQTGHTLANKYGLFDTVTIQKIITPSVTGVIIVSEDFSTQNFTYKDPNFNYLDGSGYTFDFEPETRGIGRGRLFRR